MPGPASSVEALAWVQEAVASGRYAPSVHFGVRLGERKVDMQDVFNAIEKAVSCTVYANGLPNHGGSCWRVVGPNIDEDQQIAIGVEAFLDKKRRRCVLVTVFRLNE